MAQIPTYMRSVYGICVYYTLFPTAIYAIIRHLTIYAVYIRIYAYMYVYAYIHRPALVIWQATQQHRRRTKLLLNGTTPAKRSAFVLADVQDDS